MGFCALATAPENNVKTAINDTVMMFWEFNIMTMRPVLFIVITLVFSMEEFRFIPAKPKNRRLS